MTDELVKRLRAWDGSPFDEEAHAAADRIKQLTAERDDALECNEQFSVDNQFLKKRVEETRKEWEGWQSAAFKLMEKFTALTAERDVSNELGKALEEDAGQLRAERDLLREALTALHKQALMLRGEQAYREFARAVEKQSRAALKGESHE